MNQRQRFGLAVLIIGATQMTTGGSDAHFAFCFLLILIGGAMFTAD